ncbi:MAG: helix-turn-helix transcriptional regulator [Anaerolineales bacterium]
MSDLLIGETILYWRKRHKKSQMELALEAGVSTRHLSFIESGKSRPSRELILCLAKVLNLPYRQSNVLLKAARFAAVYY